VEQPFPWRVLEDAAHTVSPPPGSPHPPASAPPTPPGDQGAAGRRPLIGLVALATAAVAVVAAAAVVIGGLSSPTLVVPGSGSPLELARVRADGASVQRTGAAPATGADGNDGGPAAGVAATTLVIDVAGAVRRPGVYRFAPGARVADAVAAAGGFGPRVDVDAASRVNLAAELRDGEQVRIPSRDDTQAAAPAHAPSPGAGPDGGSTPATALVDVNTASADALDALPGIGPATSAKIIAAREEAPFATVDELRSRGVLGEATFGKVRDLVTVGR
jgi:competence protein ComEA